MELTFINNSNHVKRTKNKVRQLPTVEFEILYSPIILITPTHIKPEGSSFIPYLSGDVGV
jgi:hypothetical protein